MKSFKLALPLTISLLFSLSCFSRPSYDTSTIDGLYQYVFALLNKTQIPSNYLEEYGAPIVPLAPYNGVLSTGNTINMTLWRTLYWQINTAYTGTGTNSFPSPIAMNASVAANIIDGAPTPITVLYANYNNVKSNAFTSNLLTVVNNQVKDVAGRSSSPYQAQTLFAACPTSGVTTTGSASFIFKSALYFTNSAVSVSSFYVDFADGGGYRAVGWNTPISASYLDTGMKQIKIKMGLSNGNSFECYTNYYVAVANQNAGSRYGSSYDFSHSFPARNGVDNGGTAFVEYSSADRNAGGKITKPLIVIEGYDITDVAPDIQPYRTNYLDFYTSINNVGNLGYDFNGNLDNAGYDIIFVQFNSGTDDITRNAAFLEEVITWVNQQKNNAGSTQQDVVMGESMGGLVARYALADMTKTSGTASTQTRLLITHDSPHHGANVPLGLQYLIQMAGHAHLFGYNITDIYAPYNEAINLLARPGTQQLLLYRSTGETTSVANTFLDGAYRTKITFGGTDPQPSYQFIATSLGSECANPLYPAYQQILNGDVDVFLFLPPLLSYRFHTKVQDYALPATGSTSKIASLLLSSKFKLFGLITIAKQVYNNTAYAPGNQIPVDGAPGAKYDETNGDAPASNGVPSFNVFVPIPGVLGIFGYIYAYSSGGNPTNFAFVPAGSALDVSPYNSSTLSQKFVSGSNPNYPSTSATYIAQGTFTQNGINSYNNYHLAFTARNANWLFDRMQNIADNLECSSSCQPDYTITGASYFCGTTSNYSVTGLALGSTVTWSVSPSGYATVYPTSGSTTTLTKLANGNVTLTATINPCNQAVTLPVTVGAPTVYASGAPYGSCNGTTQTWSLTASPASGSNWNWYVSYLGGGASIYIRNGSSPTAYADVIGGGTISLSYTDICGVAKNIGGPTVYSSCHTSAIHIITPNPAKSQITISTQPQAATGTENELQTKSNTQSLMYAVKITDRFGIVRKSLTYKQGVSSKTIIVADLNVGTYVVSIFDGKYWSSQKLLIQK